MVCGKGSPRRVQGILVRQVRSSESDCQITANIHRVDSLAWGFRFSGYGGPLFH